MYDTGACIYFYYIFNCRNMKIPINEVAMLPPFRRSAGVCMMTSTGARQ